MNFLDSLVDVSRKLGPIIEVGGGLLNMAGNKNQYSAYSSVANFNQSVFQQQAELAEAVGKQKKEILTHKKRAALSTLKSQYGFRGVQMTGSPLLIMSESASALEFDIQNAEFNSLIEANNAKSRAAYYGLESESYKKSSGISQTNSLISIVGDLAGKYAPKDKKSQEI